MTKTLTLGVLSGLTLGGLMGQPVPTAAEILKKVADNYSKAERILIRGTATFEAPGLESFQSSPFLFAFEQPDKFRIDGVPAVFGLEGEFSDRLVWVGDGEAAWTYEPRTHTYSKFPRTSPPGSIGTFFAYPPLDEPEQVVAYLRRSIPGWTGSVLDERRVATITGSQSLPVSGRQIECYVIQSDGEGFSVKHDGATRETLWIDKRRLVVWRRDELTWVNNGIQYHVRIDLTTITLDAPLPKGTFVFRPPKGSKLVAIP